MKEVNRIHSRKAGKRVCSCFDWVEEIAVAVTIVVLVFTFLFRVVTVNGISMLPNFTGATGFWSPISTVIYNKATWWWLLMCWKNQSSNG